MKDLVIQANKIIGMVTFKNIGPSIHRFMRKKEKVILMPFIYHR
jgi:hypothetical protein